MTRTSWSIKGSGTPSKPRRDEANTQQAHPQGDDGRKLVHLTTKSVMKGGPSRRCSERSRDETVQRTHVAESGCRLTTRPNVQTTRSLFSLALVARTGVNHFWHVGSTHSTMPSEDACRRLSLECRSSQKAAKLSYKRLTIST